MLAGSEGEVDGDEDEEAEEEEGEQMLKTMASVWVETG